MSLTVYMLLFATVLCEIIGQVCFKLGVGHDDDEADAASAIGGFRGLLHRIAHSPWILAGVTVYIGEFTLYFTALTLAPLSVAYPFNALAYAGVVLASRYVLRESLTRRRWLGTLAIAIGVALVCWQ